MSDTLPEALPILKVMLSDYTAAVRDLAAADKHLKTLFQAMYRSGMTPAQLLTGFQPQRHWRIIEEYAAHIEHIEKSAGERPCPIDQQPSETTCPPSAPRSSAGRSPST